MRTWDDLAASTNVTKEDRDLLIAIIAPDLDTLEQINHGNAFTYEIMLIAAHRQSAADYWYRQGKDDRFETLEAERDRLREANGILEDALQEVGDDYPGSSCQEWCQQQVKAARAALEASDE